VSHNTFALPSLPSAFSGLRILHLSDLHIDCDAPSAAHLGARIGAAIGGLRFDLCLITGDFRYTTHGPYDDVGVEMERLLPHLACRYGIYGILGNHDFIEQVPILEALGLTMLVNEAAAIERDGERIWLVGLDDPHFYGTHDFDRAQSAIPTGEFQIGLIHSPEIAVEAARHRIQLYLTGHTHAGQLCLPGGISPFKNAACNRSKLSGRWREGQMEGYTSAGTGSSGLPVRLNCPPEIAIHELYCA
jgi:predicted MPP superfamily phosphohydrolase